MNAAICYGSTYAIVNRWQVTQQMHQSQISDACFRWCSLSLCLLPKSGLHLSPYLHRLCLFILDVLPAQGSAFLHISLKHKAMRQSNRQALHLDRICCTHEFSVNGKAAFPIKRLSGLQVSLRRGDNVSGPRPGLPSGLASTHDVGYRNTELQTDQMVGFVLRSVLSAAVCFQSVLLEALFLVLPRS